MAHMIRKLRGEYAKRGLFMQYTDGHIVVRDHTRKVVTDMDMTGMDEATLLCNVELLLLVVTQ